MSAYARFLLSFVSALTSLARFVRIAYKLSLQTLIGMLILVLLSKLL